MNENLVEILMKIQKEEWKISQKTKQIKDMNKKCKKKD